MLCHCFNIEQNILYTQYIKCSDINNATNLQPFDVQNAQWLQLLFFDPNELIFD